MNEHSILLPIARKMYIVKSGRLLLFIELSIIFSRIW